MSYTYKQHTWIPREIISADKMNEYETLAEYVSTLKRVAETNSYNDLDNKPRINSHELTSNLTAAQLGFATVAMTGNFADLVGKPTKLSQFQNDRQYQTAAEVATSIANSAHLKRSIVEVLPDISSADTNTIYMLKLSNGVNRNTYAEYMVVEGKWEKLGTSDVDLTQYMKTTDIEKKLAEKVPITRKINGIALNADVTIPTASPTVNGTMKLYTATGSAVDGTMTQKLITDLLNGKMPKNGNVAGGTDFNTLTASGFYIRQGDDTHGNTNAPTNGNSHYHVLVLNFNVDYIRQFAYDVRSSALWTRGLVNKNWNAWERIYTTGFKPGAGDAGAVPTTRKVNGKALSSDITLTATDVGAPTGSVHEDATNAYIQFEGFPANSVVRRLDLIYQKSNNKPRMHVFKRDGTDLSIDFVPATRKVNNKALSGDITLNAGDVGAVPTSRTVNNKALTGNISLTASDVGALPLTGGTVNGALNVGAGMSMQTDDEGGNIILHAPSQYANRWEEDAHNGNLRFFNHGPDNGITATYTFGTNGFLSGMLGGPLRVISAATTAGIPAAVLSAHQSMPDSSWSMVRIAADYLNAVGILFRTSSLYGGFYGVTYGDRAWCQVSIGDGKAGALVVGYIKLE